MGSLIGRGRSRPIACSVGTEPSDGAVLCPPDGPGVLVHELVMERAYQQQVVQVGPASLIPPHDVMGLSESACPAPEELALAVPVLELAHHPRRGLPGHPPQADRRPGSILEHCLDPSHAEQAPDGLGVDDPTSFDLTATFARDEAVQLGMHDHGRSVGSAFAASRVDAIATSASALLASTDQPCSSPGIAGRRSARQSSARATTAPWAAGSSASKPKRLPSSKYHHDRERFLSTS